MKKIKKIILCILSLFLVLCLYQWYIQSKDTYRFKSVTYTQKTLPKEFNGFTIGYLSDLNLSTKEDLNHLKEAVKDLNKKDVDLILFGGDIYSNDSFETDQVSQILKNIHSRYGKFAVLGEKDQGDSTNNTLVFRVDKNEKFSCYFEGNFMIIECLPFVKDYSQVGFNIRLLKAFCTFLKECEAIEYLFLQNIKDEDLCSALSSIGFIKDGSNFYIKIN